MPNFSRKAHLALGYQTYGSAPKVTPTGRAKTPGRVTRASLTGSGRNHDSGALPLYLACHPKELTATPQHPECVSAHTPWGGAYLRHRKLALPNGAGYFTETTWPVYVAKYTLYVQGSPRYATNDLDDAMGWKMAALDVSVDAQLFIN